MKKLTIIAALIAFGFAANAQSLNLSNAYEAQNRGYLKKAKGYIDQAADNEATRGDAKTWFYRALIYAKIGEAQNPKNKHKECKELQQMCPRWYYDVYVSALNCKQFDKDGEYSSKIRPFIGVAATEYYNRAAAAFDAKDYALVPGLCDTAIMLYNQYDARYASNAYYLAGASGINAQNNAVSKEYFSHILNSCPENSAETVYGTLYRIYVSEKDTVNAVKTAKAYAKNFPNDTKSDMLLMQAYVMNGNIEKAGEVINKAIEKAGDDINAKSQLLSASAGIFVEQKDYATAESKYRESLAMLPNQYQANYGLGSMCYNRAIDKMQAAQDVPPEDETGLYDKLVDEAKDQYRAALPYLQAAVAYIDGLDEAGKGVNRRNLFNCLTSIKNCYNRLGQVDEMNKVQARIKAEFEQ